MNDWNLRPIQIHWPQFAIGVGFNISQEQFKLRYSDKDWRRCILITVHFMGAMLMINIPLWVDNEGVT